MVTFLSFSFHFNMTKMSFSLSRIFSQNFKISRHTQSILIAITMSSRNEETDVNGDHLQIEKLMFIFVLKDSWEAFEDESSISSLHSKASNPDNPDAQFRAVMSLRKLLSDSTNEDNRNSHIPEIIRVGLLPVLVTCLEDKGKPKLQFEAAWALTNIASGTSEQTQAVVEAGAISKFADILKSDVRVDPSSFEEDFSLKEQVLWALGNIIGDGSTLRDVVLSYQIIPTIVRLALTENVPQAFLKTSNWAISNLWRVDPPPTAVSPEEIFPALEVFLSSEDEETIADALWTLFYIADKGAPFIQRILDAELDLQLSRFLSHSSVDIQRPALRAFGSIALGSDDQTWTLLESGALRRNFPSLLTSMDRKICKDACWIISNLVVGENCPIDLVFKAGLIPLIICHLDIGENDVKKEAAWAINNIVVRQEIEYTKKLVVDYAIIPIMCNVLEESPEQTIKLMAEGLVEILETFEKEDHHLFHMARKEIRDNYGLDHCYSLRNHPDPEIQRFAEALIDLY